MTGSDTMVVYAIPDQTIDVITEHNQNGVPIVIAQNLDVVAFIRLAAWRAKLRFRYR